MKSRNTFRDLAVDIHFALCVTVVDHVRSLPKSLEINFVLRDMLPFTTPDSTFCLSERFRLTSDFFFFWLAFSTLLKQLSSARSGCCLHAELSGRRRVVSAREPLSLNAPVNYTCRNFYVQRIHRQTCRCACIYDKIVRRGPERVGQTKDQS